MLVTLTDKVGELAEDMTAVKGDIQTLKKDVQGLKGDVRGLRGDVNRLETKVDTGFAEAKSEREQMRRDFNTGMDDLEERVEVLEGFHNL